MKQKDNGYIEVKGVHLENTLEALIKPKTSELKPVFEAFANAFESLKTSSVSEKTIDIALHYTKTGLLKESQYANFEKITITDNGNGFNDEAFYRFATLRDNSKGPYNKGLGRIQYLKFFEKTVISSVYTSDEDHGLCKRELEFSSRQSFLSRSSLLRVVREELLPEDVVKMTEITLSSPYQERVSRYYQSLSLETLRHALIQQFLFFFCENRNDLPVIKLNKFVDGDQEEALTITARDIPESEVNIRFKLPYYVISGNQLEATLDEENFEFRAFKVPADMQKENIVQLVSKGESSSKMDMDIYKAGDVFDGHRFLFLLSSDYLNALDNDERTAIHVPKRKDSLGERQKSLFDEQFQYIFYEDIAKKVEHIILDAYPIIQERYTAKEAEVQKLAKRFLLNTETLKSFDISLNDSVEAVLNKYYEKEAKQVAKRNAIISEQVDAIEALNPRNADYQEDLKRLSSALVNQASPYDKDALSMYVSRRQIVLEVFERLIQSSDRRVYESELHDLFFKQKNSSVESSDLWLLSEEFLYLNGVSDMSLDQIQVDGKPLIPPENRAAMKNEFEKKTQDLGKKRPDVFLYPGEGKVLLIEFKAPDVDIWQYLNQNQHYASIIMNHADKQFGFKQFYSYLIGENITNDDVRGADPAYVHAPQFDCWHKIALVAGLNGLSDGSIYSEVLKYSAILERAKLRNKAFIDKLGIKLT